MKDMPVRILIACLLLFLVFSAKAADIYTLDPTHSHILWHINHFGFSNSTGKWMAEGTLALDEAKPANSTINATIHVADIITGIPKLDEQLKGKEFFDVEKFPIATFKSTKVTITSKKTAKVQGILTVHGVSKPITLDVVLNKMDLNPITRKKTLGFTATGKLNRSDYDISTFLPGLGDEVKLNIESEAYLSG